MTGDGTRTCEWDAENRLVAVNIGITRSELTYNGDSQRTRIVEKENGVTVRDAQLFWEGPQIIEERLSTGEVNRFFQNAEPHNGVARYVTRDHLGSVREVTDASGTAATRNDYDPYGRLTRVAGSEDSRFGYTGHMNHVPSGLALALYRAYDPALGRWSSSDPAGDVDGPNQGARAKAEADRVAKERSRAECERRLSLSLSPRSPSLRFPAPLIEPDVTISVIRLSDGFHIEVCTEVRR